MKSKHINAFQKGIVSDLDPTLIDNTQWAFPTENFEIFNRDGKGLVAVNIDGITEVFEVTASFTPVAGKSINGILFIVSLRSDGYAEIGCYPSPLSYVQDDFGFITPSFVYTDGWVKEYKPLPSLFNNIGQRVVFRTNKLGLTLDHKISLIADKSYNDSINLYIADYNVPNIMINSGFTITGELLSEELYTYSNLPESAYQFLGTSKWPSLNSLTIRSGGNFKCGMYFFYIRYVNGSYDRTAFIKEIGPVQIFNGKTILDIEGGDGEQVSDKLINIGIGDLNLNYPYFEIGVLRYFNSGNVQTSEAYLINKFYNIVSSSVTIQLKGNELQSILTEQEIMIGQASKTICKSHIILENRYWGACWKGKTINYDIAIELGNLIQMTWKASEIFDDYTLSEFEAAGANPIGIEEYEDVPLQYKNYQNTLDHVGYFRGEMYPFAIVIVWDDNTESQPVPCRAYNYFNAESAYDPYNGNLGIFRFPMYDPDYLGEGQKVNEQQRILCPSFNLGPLYSAIQNNPNKYKNIKGFYFVRGNRLDNFLGQGLMVPCTLGNDSGGATINVAPFYGSLPVSRNYFGASYYEEYVATKTTAAWGIYVPDYLFNSLEIQNGQNYYIQSIYNVNDLDTALVDAASHNPGGYAIDLQGGKHAEILDDIANTGELYLVPKGTSNEVGGTYRFSARSEQAAFYAKVVTDDTYLNRSFDIARYVGFEPDDTTGLVTTKKYIVNIYKNDPNASAFYENIIQSYQGSIGNIEYFRISPIITIDNLNAMTPSQRASYLCYNGDCFMQRTMFRSQFMRVRNALLAKLDHNSKEYEHGLTISAITENILNTAMRHDDDEHKYYPKCEVNGITLKNFVWIDEDDYESVLLDEAFYYNEGYGKTLGIKSLYGYNQTTPFREEKFEQRIWPSQKQIPGAFVNSYRVLSPTSYQDFDSNNGVISFIESILNSLISVQEHSINEHYIDERLLSNTGEGNEFVLGVGSVLSPQYRKVAEYGSRHNAYAKSPRGIYGVDTVRKIMWVAQMTTSQYGRTFLVADELSNTKLISKELDALFAAVPYGSDISDYYPDDPINGEAVVLGYDNLKKRVLFTFLYKEDSSYLGKTFVFNEMFGFFIGTEKTLPSVYYSLNDALLSSRSRYNSLSRSIYQHNDKSVPTGLYGVTEDFIVSVVINGFGEKQTMFMKYFDSLEIEMDMIEATKIDFETDYQSATLDPFMPEEDVFWKKPVYSNGRWHVPIPSASSGTNVYQPKSRMFGTWMKVTIYFNTNERVWIRNIIANTNIKP